MTPTHHHNVSVRSIECPRFLQTNFQLTCANVCYPNTHGIVLLVWIAMFHSRVSQRYLRECLRKRKSGSINMIVFKSCELIVIEVFLFLNKTLTVLEDLRWLSNCRRSTFDLKNRKKRIIVYALKISLFYRLFEAAVSLLV